MSLLVDTSLLSGRRPHGRDVLWRAACSDRPDATNDLWIAATALAHDLTLITADARQAALPLVRCKLVGAQA